jgi:uncharacterized membrane protein
MHNIIGRVAPAEGQASGLGLAWVVLIVLLGALVYTGLAVWRGSQGRALIQIWPPLQYAIPILSLVGLGIAGYLAYVEIFAVQAVCGPVGDCNAVQSSAYARLFGIPVGVVGLLGYAAIVGAWVWGTRRGWLADQMPLITFCAALFSVLFSTYLTGVELFVLQAVCIWCLSSAILVALILIVSVEPMLRAGKFFDD